jgi:hypothetical protein
LGGVTVFEMGLSLPWHEAVLAKAVRTVYQRIAVIFQYNRLESEQILTQTSFSPSRTVCLVLSGDPTSVIYVDFFPSLTQRLCCGVGMLFLESLALYIITHSSVD